MMNLKRGMWAFVVIAAAVMAVGCKEEPSNKPEPKPQTTPPVVTPTKPATTTAAGPTSANVASAGLTNVPPVQPLPPLPANIDAKKIPQTARAPGWYQWRGPEQTGVSREKGLPETWNPKGENVIWTTDFGGMSSPVIWNGKLYTFTRAGEVQAGDNLVPGPRTQEALTCVDITNGKVLWQHKMNMTQTEVPFHRLGWSSPCVDPSTGRVFALGSQCNLICLEGDTGKPVWQRQMTEEFGMISTFGGRTQSPMIDEDQVFIAGISFGFGDHARGQHRLFAFNKHTGELNWSNNSGGLPVDAPQNTPVIAVIKGQRLVVFAAGDGGIHAMQARTGKKVWSFKASLRGINTSVVVDGERLYCSHGLDNADSHELGRVFCLDLATIENGSPKEVWKKIGIEAAFPTSCVTDKWLYVVGDRCRLHQIDKQTGKVAWIKPMGTVGKPSPVWGDGKLYVADGNGRFTILVPAAKEADVKILSRVDLTEKLGREYAIYGSPALCDGRLYLQTATKIYCIGKKDAKPDQGPIPPMPEENPVEQKVAQVQVLPFDVVLHAGQAQSFKVRTFDANGRLIADLPATEAKWAIAQLTIPAPPRPVTLPKPENVPATPGTRPTTAASTQPDPTAAAAKDSPDAARAALLAAATQPAAPPTKAGNLMGDVDPTGKFTSKNGPNGLHQAGGIEATVNGITGQSRVRVFPPLPWKFDFEAAQIGKPPLTWLGAGAKYAVVQDPDDAKNKVLQKLMDIDLYYRARTNFGMANMSDYTIQADAKMNEKEAGGGKMLPTAAVLNSRYVLALDGMGQFLQIHVWPSALPDGRNPFGAAHQEMPFVVEAKKWYRLKLIVTQEGEKAVARGKAWLASDPEPKDWMLTLIDAIPNRTGNPGLFSVSLVGDFKCEVYYDNILLTPNTPEPVHAAGTGGTELNK